MHLPDWLRIKDFLTGNEIKIVLFLFAVAGAGIWIRIFSPGYPETQNKQFENIEQDSIFTEILNADFDSTLNNSSSFHSEKKSSSVEKTKINEPELTKESININTGSIAELIKLPGIGEKVAANIIEYRKANGKFKKKEELMNVSRIGEKKYKAIEQYITIK